MAKRYELSEQQWDQIRELLPGKASDPGRTAADNRNFVNGVLWILRSGARWSDLPERYGKWKTVHKRFTRWAKAEVWEKGFASLIPDRDNPYLVLDSTIVKAHQQAVTGQGGLRDLVRAKRMRVVIPSKINRKRAIRYDKETYKHLSIRFCCLEISL